jgi:hypothetical protein
MPDGQPPSPTPPAPPTDPSQGQPPAPVPTPPPNPPAPPAPAQPSADNGKTFTQADVDRIINERLQRAEQSWQTKQDDFNKKLAELLGGKPDETDPAKLLQQQQAATKAAQDTAIEAVAQALALKAGIKEDRVDMFVAIAKQAGMFSNVDLTPDGKTALATALTAKANEFPEWKGTVLPAASGGDRTQGGGNGKKTWTRQQIEAMSSAELAANADELAAAAAEGRIK